MSLYKLQKHLFFLSGVVLLNLKLVPQAPPSVTTCLTLMEVYIPEGFGADQVKYFPNMLPNVSLLLTWKEFDNT